MATFADAVAEASGLGVIGASRRRPPRTPPRPPAFAADEVVAGALAAAIDDVEEEVVDSASLFFSPPMSSMLRMPSRPSFLSEDAEVVDALEVDAAALLAGDGVSSVSRLRPPAPPRILSRPRPPSMSAAADEVVAALEEVVLASVAEEASDCSRRRLPSLLSESRPGRPPAAVVAAALLDDVVEASRLRPPNIPRLGRPGTRPAAELVAAVLDAVLGSVAEASRRTGSPGTEETEMPVMVLPRLALEAASAFPARSLIGRSSSEPRPRPLWASRRTRRPPRGRPGINPAAVDVAASAVVVSAALRSGILGTAGSRPWPTLLGGRLAEACGSDIEAGMPDARSKAS